LAQDKIVKALGFNKTIRIYGIVATDTVDEIKRRIHASPEVSVALGRLAMGSLLVGALDSTDSKVYTRMSGGGPVGAIHADSDSFGNVRAYASNPAARAATGLIGEEAIEAIVGRDGFLSIIKDLGLKERFTSQTRLVTGSVNMDFTKYFSESQQTPTAMHVDVFDDGTNVLMAGGFVAQVLPGVSPRVIAQVGENMKKIPSVTEFLLTNTIEDLIDVLTEGTTEVLETLPVQFHCTCSKERFLDAFATLPRAELEEMLASADDEEVICQYCGDKYYIKNEELAAILDKKDE